MSFRVGLAVDSITPELTGIGRYTFELARRLPLHPEIRSLATYRGSVRVSDFSSLSARPTRWTRWKQRVIRLVEPQLDVFHGPNYSLPRWSDGGVVTMSTNTTCTNLVMDAAANGSSLTQNAGVVFTITGDAVLNQPTASTIAGWYINAGSATVAGSVSLGGTTTTTGRVAKIVITTGSLDISGDLIYNSAASTSQTAVIDMSGGAGNLYLVGSLTLANGSGTLTPGTTSTVTFDGVADQTITDGSAITYS